MSDETVPEPEVREGSRIAKVMARAGLCSRREAEAWIVAGRVAVNGKVLESPAYNVGPDDDVKVDGQRLSSPERTRLFMFHKPRGLVTTARDPEGRPTIFDGLPPELPRLIAVGRLDISTEGLMLLTNDGGLARVLELPSTGWLRRYRVRAHGSVDQTRLDALGQGITVDGVDYAGIEARLDREQGSNAWITMGLREGKNREIKRVLEHLGLAVNRLIRVSFGPFELGDLAEGEVVEVRTRILRDQLGVKLAREAGADFDTPIVDRAPAREETPAPQRRPSRAPARTRPSPSDRDRGEAPRRGPPPPSTPERKRKHVSVLRAEGATGAEGPRKRIARGATTDRKGRAVAVERISKAVAEPTDEAAGKRRGRAPGPRRERSAEAGGSFAERPRRPRAFEARPARDGDGRDRPQRSERSDARADFKPRGPRRDGAAGGPRKETGERGSRDAGRRFDRDEARPPRRAPRAFETRPARDGDGRDRPQRSERSDARADFKPRGPRKETGERGSRDAGRGFDRDEARPPRRGPGGEGGAKPRAFSGAGGGPRPFAGKRGGAPGGGPRPGGGPKGAGGSRRPPRKP